MFELRLSCLLLGAVILSIGWQEASCRSVAEQEVHVHLANLILEGRIHHLMTDTTLYFHKTGISK